MYGRGGPYPLPNPHPDANQAGMVGAGLGIMGQPRGVNAYDGSTNTVKPFPTGPQRGSETLHLPYDGVLAEGVGHKPEHVRELWGLPSEEDHPSSPPPLPQDRLEKARSGPGVYNVLGGSKSQFPWGTSAAGRILSTGVLRGLWDAKPPGTRPGAPLYQGPLKLYKDLPQEDFPHGGEYDGQFDNQDTYENLAF